LQFIIQADFDTSANRQDIVTTSRRNIKLREEIGSAFESSIRQFCQDEALCYAWPVLLPSQAEPFDRFWQGLCEIIRRRLSVLPVLRARHSSALRKIADVVRVGGDFEDEHKQPLLDSIERDPFVSPRYPMESIQHLDGYGLRVMNMRLVFDLLEDDLKNSLTSKMQSKHTNEAWHSRMARILVRPPKARALQLTVLPIVRRGCLLWKCPNEQIAYFPEYDGLPVPSGTDIPLIQSEAVCNTDRKALFTYLGVKEPLLAQVRAAILRFHDSGDHSIAATARSLRFLYLTHDPTLHAREQLREIQVHDTDTIARRPRDVDCYLPSDGPYDAKALLGLSPGVLGEVLYLVHPAYTEDVPGSRNLSQMSWTRWLHQHIGIRQRLRLVSGDGKCLSLEWEHVARNLPKKLLGFLSHVWRDEKGFLIANSELMRLLQETDATHLCMEELPVPCTLQETLLPSSKVKALVHRFAAQDERFPILALSSDIPDRDLPRKWSFLCEDLGVLSEDEMPSLLLRILHWIKRINELAPAIERSHRIPEIYLLIQAACEADVDSKREKRAVLCVILHILGITLR